MEIYDHSNAINIIADKFDPFNDLLLVFESIV